MNKQDISVNQEKMKCKCYMNILVCSKLINKYRITSTNTLSINTSLQI